MPAARTITVTINDTTPTPTSLRNASNPTVALVKYGRLVNAGADDAVIVRRTDHPHVSGDYFYAIRRADKHAWTSSEYVLNGDEIAALWYAEDCPRP